jgi:hypothetical protein
MRLSRLWVAAFVIVGLTLGCRQPVRLAGGSAMADSSRQSIEGLWQGTLKAGAISLRVVFKIEKKPDGSLTGTLDSIDQGAKDIPVSEVRLQEGDVRFQVNAVFGVYEGKLAPDGATMTGTWKQGGASLPLTLERVNKIPEVRRPQEPKQPYPYHEEEVAYENRQGGSRLAGTLTASSLGASPRGSAVGQPRPGFRGLDEGNGRRPGEPIVNSSVERAAVSVPAFLSVRAAGGSVGP